MREFLVKVVADLVAELDPNELSPRQLARVELAAASTSSGRTEFSVEE